LSSPPCPSRWLPYYRVSTREQGPLPSAQGTIWHPEGFKQRPQYGRQVGMAEGSAFSPPRSVLFWRRILSHRAMMPFCSWQGAEPTGPSLTSPSEKPRRLPAAHTFLGDGEWTGAACSARYSRAELGLVGTRADPDSSKSLHRRSSHRRVWATDRVLGGLLTYLRPLR
jgi:hypothetical protein